MSRYLEACESMINAETKVACNIDSPKMDSVPEENIYPLDGHKLFNRSMPKELGEAIDNISLDGGDGPDTDLSKIKPTQNGEGKVVLLRAKTSPSPAVDDKSEPVLETVTFDINDIIDELPVAMINYDEFFIKFCYFMAVQVDKS